MNLSNRQQLAKRLADELARFEDAWIVSLTPLPDDKKLRVQIADRARNEIIQTLRDWGYEPVFVSVLPRVCPTGLMAACVYEIDFPRERQPIVDDRIQGEIATREKPSWELEQLRRYLGIGPKK
jgi:hypothetical protein